ncbi:hypothetical protein GCM10023322_31600 [Rugosimonospora acidiphila]|uniref:Uncharacterized protein n=1 Tax=Rugosimonospora acidiphila TaxID=556531 RepID=A0ABP9RTA8_9ACTN
MAAHVHGHQGGVRESRNGSGRAVDRAWDVPAWWATRKRIVLWMAKAGSADRLSPLKGDLVDMARVSWTPEPQSFTDATPGR